MATKLITSKAQLSGTNTDLPVSQGWLAAAYGNGTFVAVAYNMTSPPVYSTDGITWKQSNAIPGGTKTWQCITYGNGKFVAISGGSGLSDVAAYSTDGINWSLSNPLPASLNWTGVAYGNGKFVAIASGTNVAAFSSDGITWSQSSLPPSTSTGYNSQTSTQQWSGVTYGNGKFVAVCSNNSNASAYSTDGAYWYPSILPSGEYWYTVTYANNMFVAVGSDKATHSTDGQTWSAQTTLPLNFGCNSIAYGNGLFIGVARYKNTAIYSNDGINWYVDYFATNSTNGWTGITFANNMFVGLGFSSSIATYIKYYGTTNTKVLNSQIGVTYQSPPTVQPWTLQNPPIAGTNYSWTANFVNNQFFATAQNQPSAAWSSDGLNWSTIYYPITSSSRRIAYNGSVYAGFAAGEAKSFYSYNGTIWVVNSTSSLTTQTQWTDVVYGVANGTGIFVALAAPNSAWESAYSLDGVNWTFSGTSNNSQHGTNSIAYGVINNQGIFVAVPVGGGASHFVYSTDGKTWNASASFTSLGANVSWQKVVFGRNSNKVPMFVAVSANASGQPAGTLFSYDGITWSVGSIPNYTWNDLIYTESGLFIAKSANAHTDGTCAYSTNGTSFVLDTSFIASGDPSGRFATGNGIIIAPSSFSGNPSYPNRFNRATLTQSNTIKILQS